MISDITIPAISLDQSTINLSNNRMCDELSRQEM